METLGRRINPSIQDPNRSQSRIFLLPNHEILRFITKQGPSMLSIPTTPYCSHLLIFLSDQPLRFWMCPWWDSRDGKVGTTLSSQFAEGKGERDLVRLRGTQHLLGLSPGPEEEPRKGLFSPKAAFGLPTPSAHTHPHTPPSILASGHTCDSFLSPPGGSCSGCTVPCSSHNVSPASHPSGPACEYAPALSSASQSRSVLGFPLHSKARGQPGAWGELLRARKYPGHKLSVLPSTMPQG